MAALGMPGGAAAELPEPLDLGDRHVRVAGQVKETVEQHRAVSVRHDKTVSVGPIRSLRVKAQILREQHRRNVSHAHRHAGMPRFGLFDGVHRERAQSIGHVAQLRVARSGEGRGGGGGSVRHPGKIVTAAARASSPRPPDLHLSTDLASAVPCARARLTIREGCRQEGSRRRRNSSVLPATVKSAPARVGPGRVAFGTARQNAMRAGPDAEAGNLPSECRYSSCSSTPCACS